MNEPLKSSQANLKAVPDQALLDEESGACGHPQGSGSPPVFPDNAPIGLLMLLAFGLALIALSGFALAHDPATEIYRQNSFTLGKLRVSFELLLMTIGCGCTFTPLSLLAARFRARKVERLSSGKVKSMKAKRLDKVSDQDILSTIANYISNLLGAI